MSREQRNRPATYGRNPVAPPPDSVAMSRSVDDTRGPTVVDYSGKTKSELKELLQGRGLPVSGNKAELIARLEE